MNMNMSMEIRYIEPAALHDEMLRLRQEEQMDFLECLTGMDWGEPDAAKDTPDTPRGLGVVYQLESTVTGKRTAIRTATLNREHPELPSVCDIWKAADFLEREVFDFYGVVFVGHPDIRRLYLRNDWVGHPMRKDDDPEAPCNMIFFFASNRLLNLVYSSDFIKTSSRKLFPEYGGLRLLTVIGFSSRIKSANTLYSSFVNLKNDPFLFFRNSIPLNSGISFITE